MFQELTDADVSEETEEAIRVLATALLENQIFELLVSNLKRFNEKNSDEKQVLIENEEDLKLGGGLSSLGRA